MASLDPKPRKSLGQHWLFDEAILDSIVQAGRLSDQDTVVEVGPGLGSLTAKLAGAAQKVIAIEVDENLAQQLKARVGAANLLVEQKDVLEYDFSKIPAGYKVISNIPYYLTSHLVRMFLECPNPPSLMVLLVQKEVAERMLAGPGEMSLLSVSVQFYCQVQAGIEVPAAAFRPPPKVDSKVVILTRRQQPLFKDLDRATFFRLAKAGFSQRRKKLRSSLSAGLQLEKSAVDEIVQAAGLRSDARAQELSLENWAALSEIAAAYLK